MMSQFLSFAIICAGLMPVRAETWVPDDRLLAAVRLIESSNGRFLRGDAGRSLGEFQMSAAAWKDVSAWRRQRGLKAYPYRPHVFNQSVARVYASNFLTILRTRLKAELKRAPTVEELYAAYNLGLTMFARCDYRLDQVNRVTAQKCRLVRQLVEGDVRS